MKKHIGTIICGIVILFSIILIIKTVVGSNNKDHKSGLPHKGQSVEIIPEEDPLTEMYYENKLIDLGFLKPDTIVHYDYTLKNIGENPLIIYHVSPDCNCTNYKLSKKIAPPGDSIILKLTIDTRGKRKFMLNNTIKANTAIGFYRLRIAGEVLDADKKH